jgi:eukaryotic-like serine/threonine-protein kinase
VADLASWFATDRPKPPRKVERFLYSFASGREIDLRSIRRLDIDVGQIIAGKYELVRLIGKGAMGQVWLATHNSLGGEFAIKLVEQIDDVEAETAAGRFQLEAQIAAKLSRKTRHIVSVSDHGEENGLAYLVMELLEGQSLEDKTKHAGSLAVPEVAAIVSQVSRALVLAHEEGIFHRDLKPANVWLGRDEDGRLLVKLLDFGIARSKKPFRTRSPFATSKDMVLGTPSYMSPEQARGLDTLDYRCDLWALAVVAYEALTQSIPFEGETVEDIFLAICTYKVVPVRTRRADLPPAIDAFFARAFHPKIDQRFSSAAELTETFEQLVTPEELEQALGLPPTPTSARRLEAARSNPDLARPAANGGTGIGIGPELGPSITGTDPFAARQRSSPDLDPVALGEMVLPRRAGSRSILAIAGLFAAVLIVALFFLTFRGTNATSPPLGDRSPPSTPSGSPPSATVATTATPATPATEPPPTPIEPSPPTSKAVGVSGKPKMTGQAPPSQPPVAGTGATRPAAAPTPSATTPTPAPAKTVKKDEIF